MGKTGWDGLRDCVSGAVPQALPGDLPRNVWHTFPPPDHHKARYHGDHKTIYLEEQCPGVRPDSLMTWHPRPPPDHLTAGLTNHHPTISQRGIPNHLKKRHPKPPPNHLTAWHPGPSRGVASRTISQPGIPGHFTAWHPGPS